MSLLSIETQIELLQNLLADPDDWISYEILRLNAEAEAEAKEPKPENGAICCYCGSRSSKAIKSAQR